MCIRDRELLVAAQALDFRLTQSATEGLQVRAGAGVEEAHRRIRSVVPHLDRDRLQTIDIGIGLHACPRRRPGRPGRLGEKGRLVSPGAAVDGAAQANLIRTARPVSYTHLTLPTILRV